jgi:hypothetical protein
MGFGLGAPASMGIRPEADKYESRDCGLATAGCAIPEALQTLTSPVLVANEDDEVPLNLPENESLIFFTLRALPYYTGLYILSV